MKSTECKVQEIKKEKAAKAAARNSVKTEAIKSFANPYRFLPQF